jgi:hypothetical protein
VNDPSTHYNPKSCERKKRKNVGDELITIVAAIVIKKTFHYNLNNYFRENKFNYTPLSLPLLYNHPLITPTFSLASHP